MTYIIQEMAWFEATLAQRGPYSMFWRWGKRIFSFVQHS